MVASSLSLSEDAEIPTAFIKVYGVLQDYLKSHNEELEKQLNIKTLKEPNEKLLMVNESELTDILTDVSREIGRRLGITGSPDRFCFFEPTSVETRRPSQDRLTLLSESSFLDVVYELTQELTRRYPGLSSEDCYVSKRRQSSFLHMKMDSLQNMMEQLYILKSEESLLLQNQNDIAQLSLPELQENFAKVSEELAEKTVKLQEVQLESENLKFMKDDFAEKSTYLQASLTSLQEKFDELHTIQLGLIEAKKDNEAIIDTLSSKVASLELDIKDIGHAVSMAKGSQKLCESSQLKGFSTNVGTIKKYHCLNDLLNLCDVLVQAAHSLIPLELLETLKLFIRETYPLSQSLEVQQIDIAKIEDDAIKLQLTEAAEISKSLRTKFGYLLGSLISAARNLTMNKRDQHEIKSFENLLLEAYILIVKMYFHRLMVQQQLPSPTSDVRLAYENTIGANEIRTPSPVKQHLDSLDCDMAPSNYQLVDTTVEMNNVSESLEKAKHDLEKSTNNIISLIQKLLLHIKVSTTLSSDIFSLIDTICQALTSLASTGNAYLSFINDEDLRVKGLALMKELSDHTSALRAFKEASLGDINQGSKTTLIQCKSAVASKVYDIAKITKQVLNFLA